MESQIFKGILCDVKPSGEMFVKTEDKRVTQKIYRISNDSYVMNNELEFELIPINTDRESDEQIEYIARIINP